MDSGSGIAEPAEDGISRETGECSRQLDHFIVDEETSSSERHKQDSKVCWANRQLALRTLDRRKVTEAQISVFTLLAWEPLAHFVKIPRRIFTVTLEASCSRS